MDAMAHTFMIMLSDPNHCHDSIGTVTTPLTYRGGYHLCPNIKKLWPWILLWQRLL